MPVDLPPIGSAARDEIELARRAAAGNQQWIGFKHYPECWIAYLLPTRGNSGHTGSGQTAVDALRDLLRHESHRTAA